MFHIIVLESAFHKQSMVIPPPQSTFAKRSLERLFYCAHKHELHLVANLEGDVVLDVLAICPGQDNLFYLGTMRS